MASREVYNESNRIVSVDYSRFSRKEYGRVLSCGESVEERQKASKALVDYLCDKYGIPRCYVTIRNRPQPSVGRGKLYGRYLGCFHRIEIWNLTAKQQKVVSIKSFADTLLHEFMHHYDRSYLKLGDSIHSAGFYKRISDLQRKLSA